MASVFREGFGLGGRGTNVVIVVRGIVAGGSGGKGGDGS
jgi:hypothetical protein